MRDKRAGAEQYGLDEAALSLSEGLGLGFDECGFHHWLCS
jgi:hypothetical protein